MVYSDQSRYYCMLKDYTNALRVLNEYKPPYKSFLFRKALLLDILNQSDSAQKLYKYIYYYNQHISFKNKYDSIDYVTLFTFLIYGHDSVINKIKFLTQKYPKCDFIPYMYNEFDTISRKDYILQQLQN
jgi:hypothetical protein